jgi:hypothetical protein
MTPIQEQEIKKSIVVLHDLQKWVVDITVRDKLKIEEDRLTKLLNDEKNKAG